MIDECWHPEPVARPTFSEIIVRLDRIVGQCSKQGWWKDTFKLRWYTSLTKSSLYLVPSVTWQIKKKKKKEKKPSVRNRGEEASQGSCHG